MLVEPGSVGLLVVVAWVVALAALCAGAWWLARRFGEEPGAPRRPRSGRLIALFGCTVTLIGVGVGAFQRTVLVLLDGTALAGWSLGLGAVLAVALLLLGRRHPGAALITASVAVLASAVVGVAVASGSHSTIEWESRSAVFWAGSLLPGVVAVLGVRRPLPAGVVLLAAAALGTLATRAFLAAAGSPSMPVQMGGIVLLNPLLWGGLLLLLSAAVGHRQAATPGRQRVGTGDVGTTAAR